MTKLFWLIALITFLPVGALAIESVEFDNAAQRTLYQDLAEELRCLVCQNQNIADSNASLAVDLRKIIVEKVRAGESRTEIIEFMRDRYGDFVHYKPPLNPTTSMLWIGPALIFALGVWVLIRFIRSANRPNHALSDAEQARLAQLLDHPNDTKK